jgi:hypothetical protein
MMPDKVSGFTAPATCYDFCWDFQKDSCVRVNA